MLNEEVMLDRKRWIEELVSDRVEQITGSLGRIDDLAFCVMGVGGWVYDPEVEFSDTSEEKIGRQFGLTKKQSMYLVAMNDGGPMNIEKGKKPTINGWAVNYKVIRNTNIQRDFKFIARWLEILTTLQRMA